MKYLFIDTETTGLPKDHNCSPMAYNNWPRLVSVAFILCDGREIVEKKYFIIKPKGFIIPSESTKIHRITTAEAISKGRDLTEILDIIKPMINECDFIVGHNVLFDINVLNAEFYRDDNTLPVSLKPYYCTMMLAKDYCGLPNNKYPTLKELYSILKGESISIAHNAMADAQACMECFWILKDIGIVGSKIGKPKITIYPTEDNIFWAANRISKEYATKAYAYLTIACNLLRNKNNFLKPSESDNLLNEFPQFKEIKSLEKEFEYNSIAYSCTKDPNTEWINRMFNFFDEEIQITMAFYTFGGRGTVREMPALRSYHKEIEKEVGIKELIDEFKLNDIESPYATLILDKESLWVDIAIEAVKKGIGSKQLSQADTERYFISMIEYFNEIRETERLQKLDKYHKEYEKDREYNEKILREGTWMLPNDKQTSSGCMVFISVLISTGWAFCYFLFLLL